MATDQAAARERMLQAHLAGRDIRDPRVLDAMRAVPRERFVGAGMEEFAYEDSPLPIGAGQTISQPYIVALMVQAAEIAPGDRVLEVGAGSGYAAAVLSRLAARVVAIERHASLAGGARDRLAALGYDNATVYVGDGSEGWPEAAPYDAILVAAGAPEPPPALCAQLAVGGRLVVPVGAGDEHQRLRRIRRVDAERYEHEDLGGVQFVPLIGVQGWAEDGTRAASNHVPAAARGADPVALVAAAMEPLAERFDDAFAAAFDRFADRRVVLLGEASHGTSEFYRARAAITRRLVARHGFDIVAVEADWPDAAVLNRHVRGLPQREGQPPVFQRFPTWMWRNVEVAEFVHWMRAHNAGRPADGHAGFYGLDIYSMGASIEAVLAYLDDVDPEAAAAARERYGCLTPWQRDPATYGRAVLTRGYRGCEAEVVRQCRELLARRHDPRGADLDEGFLDASQNARLVAAAERYYRVMYYGGAESWNLRDTHMFDTLCHLLEAKPGARAVVWAHNSHIGDARHTDMGRARGELNIGQLCRERFGESCALVGFGMHEGEVAAAHEWGDELQVMRVRPSRAGSVERLCHDAGVARGLLDFERARREPALRRVLADERLERFIGVVYRPDTELQSHYAAASLLAQFDAWAWFDRTTAVTPLGAQPAGTDDVPDTWPWGL